MIRILLRYPVRFADDGALDHDKVGDDFSSGPSPACRARFPLIGRDGIGRAQQAMLGEGQLLKDRFESRHETVSTKSRTDSQAARSDRGTASLLKCVRQLQDACFAKCRAEDLQTDGQLTADFAARHRDSRHTR